HTSGVDTNGIGFTVSTVNSISLTPANLSIPINSVQRFVATATYANNSTQALTGNNVTWGSSSTSIATLDVNGIATTLAQGQTTIQATLGSVSASTTLTVGGPSFQPVGNLNDPRFGHTATLLQNGKVLIVGGGNVCCTLSSAELYDPVTRSFTRTGYLNTPRQYHVATLLSSGKVLITGGEQYIPNCCSEGVPTQEIYDPSSGIFTQLSGQRSKHPLLTIVFRILPEG